MRLLVAAGFVGLAVACAPTPQAPLLEVGAPCAPPAGVVSAAPELDPQTPLVSHTEQIVIARPLAETLARVRSTPLEEAIDRDGRLPYVVNTALLQDAPYSAPGTQRFVCLSDGSTLRERVLINSDTPTNSMFSYVVWDYGTEAARPVLYGTGAFRYEAIDAASTRVSWTYSFALRENTFPGSMGALGRFAFRVGFLERDYAAMMRATLRGQKARAEAQRPG